MIITADGKQREELQQDIMPVRIVESNDVENAEGLMVFHPACVSFKGFGWTGFRKTGSFVVLDFGKELCGGIRIVVRGVAGLAKWRVTFGESLTEAYSTLGVKNATNDHAPRDFEFVTSGMSDLKFGQTGFRFVRLELIEGEGVAVQNIYAVSYLPLFEREAEIKTNDELLNQIIETAAYTLKLNFQNGYIWDGIKRDRLVWSGDLHPEILTSLYLFGDNDNIKNSLEFLKESTVDGAWINQIPSYSSWWVINLCEYCSFTNNWDFFEEHKAYALSIIERLDGCIAEDGTLELTDGFGMEYFLDWSTHNSEDAKAGVASQIRWMAQRFSAIEENAHCEAIIRKLAPWVDVETSLKPVRAFQIIAGRHFGAEDVEMLQKDGAHGFSTFMAYYILRAIAAVGGEQSLEILKTYYGSMLSRGATSFWEDFDMDWLENSGRIDELPEEGHNDIHGDYGKYCYIKFRHSLCHGWASGVLSFIIEHILGVSIADGGKKVSVKPHLLGLTDIDATIPLKDGMLEIAIHGDDIQVKAPETTKIER